MAQRQHLQDWPVDIRRIQLCLYRKTESREGVSSVLRFLDIVCELHPLQYQNRRRFMWPDTSHQMRAQDVA